MPAGSLQLLKRRLVSVLLELSQQYGITSVTITRDSPDADIKKAFRRVILKVHPDKGGSEAATKKLNDVWSAWLDEVKNSEGPGRPTSEPTPPPTSSPASAKQKTTPKKRPATQAQPSKPVHPALQSPSRQYRINAEAILLTYQGIYSLSEWSSFLSFIKRHLRDWRVQYWCATFESNQEEEGIHAHLMLQFRTKQDRSTAGFIFHGIRPDARQNDLCGEGMCRRRPQQSIDRGMFYVFADKVGTLRLLDGTLCVEGNYKPCWTDCKCRYQVLGKWPETLWKQRKLTHDNFDIYLHLCRDGVPGRKRNFDAVVQREKRDANQETMAKRSARIRANPDLFSEFPRVAVAEEWLAKFREDALRYPILIVRGRSHTGKTEWAKSLFKQPLVVRIAGLMHFPDGMREFDRDKHDGIVLDDIRDLLFLSEHQDKVQGKYDAEVEFGSTQGGTCAYYLDLFAIPIVATINFSTKHMEALEQNDFLSCRGNRVLVDWPIETD
jgi:hypothetical protein